MKWLILGAGVSGRGAAELLVSRGDEVTFCDDVIPIDQESLVKLGPFIETNNVNLDQYEGICRSPGLSDRHDLVSKALKEQRNLCSEIDLARASYSGPVIAVTGTNGKSTVVTMIEYILQRQGINALKSGNIGIPPTALLARGIVPDVFVWELSSYQIASSASLGADIALLTSLSFDHQEWHGSMANYIDAKLKLFEKSTRHRIVAKSVFDSFPETKSSLGRCFVVHSGGFYTAPECETTDFMETTGVSGINVNNAVMASLAAELYLHGSIKKTSFDFTEFSSLPHRLEDVGKMGPVQFINDSKSTNVESSIVALDSFDSPILLLLGGKAKGESFSQLLDHLGLEDRVIAFGDARAQIATELRSVLLDSYRTAEEMLHSLKKYLDGKWQVILFSPGCASFDEFRNFEQRGDAFRHAVENLTH